MERAFTLVVYGSHPASKIAAMSFAHFCGGEVDLLSFARISHLRDGLAEPRIDRALNGMVTERDLVAEDSYRFVIFLEKSIPDPIPRISGRRLQWRLPDPVADNESPEVAELRVRIATTMIENKVQQWCMTCCTKAESRVKRGVQLCEQLF